MALQEDLVLHGPSKKYKGDKITKRTETYILVHKNDIVEIISMNIDKWKKTNLGKPETNNIVGFKGMG